MYLELLNGLAQICHYFFPTEAMARAGEGEPPKVETLCAPRTFESRN